jgi:hypothetical protein
MLSENKKKKKERERERERERRNQKYHVLLLTQIQMLHSDIGVVNFDELAETLPELFRGNI